MRRDARFSGMKSECFSLNSDGGCTWAESDVALGDVCCSLFR